MIRSVRFAVACALLAFSSGCASERAPINRVQPEALQKSFFVGASLTDDADDPQFYYRPTVADVDYGASQSGLFTASYAQTTARVRWEITEDKLLARLAYERIEGATGNGIEETNTGQIAAAFRIEKHFDVRRDYNPQTGEELNVVVENSTDRPWYEREFMRVDWSQNLLSSAYELDTLAALKIFAEEPLVYEPVAYSVKDPSDPDAPVFEASSGYFDVTNKVYVTPQILDTPFGAFPACFFSPDVLNGGAPIANCNPVELKVRLSFRRVEDSDYQPVDWDGTRMDMFGMFTTAERRGFERKYGVVDDKWYRFASRHNIWQQSHARDAAGELVRCNTEKTTPAGADPDRDTSPVTGTADECDAVGEGSRCDKFAHACTLPYRQRQVKTRPFYYGQDSDPTLFDTVRDAVSQWDVALRHSVITSRYTECLRVSQTGAQQTDEEIAACRKQFPTSEARADVLENEPVPVFVFCHNPVATDDPAECGARGLVARVGDLRYNITNVIQNPQVPSPWGILADAIDPLTGEVVAASVNIWNAVTDFRSQLTVDQMRWYLGEISNDDVSSGRYLNDYLAGSTRAPAGKRLAAVPLLDEAQVQRRLASVDRTLQTGPTLKAIPNLKQADLIDWASQQARAKYGETVLGKGNTGARARLLTSRDSTVETQLTTNSYLRLAGLNPATPPSAATMDLASPLRGNAVAFKAELDRLRENQMGQDGQCLLSAPEPLSVDDWAKIMAEKFPLPENPTASDVMNRNQKWHDYVRRVLTYGVILHELGHSMGLRHVFTSSFDALNFHPQYWQLRTRDGEETSYCTEVTSDGESCVGPRWRDPVTEKESAGMIWTWEHTSVMDYAGDLSQEAVGLGAYDRAAIRFAYGDVTDVVDDPSVRCPPSASGTGRSCSPNGRTISDLIDSSFGGIGGPWYRDNSGFFHYSQLGQKLELVRGCREVDTSPPADWDEAKNGKYSPVFDGHIVNGTRCDGLPNDYVAYSELQLDAPGFQQAFGAFGGAPRKFDSRGRVRRPYMFGSDEYADIGNIAVLRDDNGADAYEIANFMINSYEDSHIWDSYRRNRSSFSLKQAFMRGYTRYNAKLKEISKGFGLFSELFSATNLLDLYTSDAQADGLLRPSAIAASMVFDHFTRILTRPNSGTHFLDAGYDPRNVASPGDFPVFRSDDQQVQVNAGPNNGGVRMTVPDGSQGVGTDLIYGGRPLFNQLDRSKGYYATQYDQWVGSYYDKTLVADMLTDCEDRFISQSRDDFYDGRYRNISFATIFPEGVRRLLGAALTEDQTALAWRVETKDGRAVLGSDQTPSLGMGYRSFWPKDGPEVCWRRTGSVICKEYPSGADVDVAGPSESLAIDPEIGFEVQKFLVFSALVNLPESYKADWIDLMRIFRLGTDATPLFPPDQQATWVDPLSGQSYVAHRYGTETIDGQAVDRGIGARMLDWMNVLTLEAYETQGTDPATGALSYVRGADGQPVVKSQRFVNRVKGYQGLLDFMQQVSGLFGFYAPNWRGVY